MTGFRPLLLLAAAAAGAVSATTTSALELDFASAVPKKPLSKAETKKVLDKLQAEESKIAQAVERMTKLSTSDAKLKKEKHEKLFHHSKGARKLSDQERKKEEALEKSMSEWDEKMERLNTKSRIGAVNVLSKLRNAIHLVKKGALSGNADAKMALEKVMMKMGQMAGR
eukprot:g1632.t1